MLELGSNRTTLVKFPTSRGGKKELWRTLYSSHLGLERPRCPASDRF